MSQGGTNIMTAPPVSAFIPGDIPDLIKTQGYSPYSTTSSTVIETTWPNTDIPFEGTISPELHPKPFSPVLVEALQSISKTYDRLKLAGEIRTPYSAQPEKEREAVIQHTFWIYSSRITGKKFQKNHFR